MVKTRLLLAMLVLSLLGLGAAAGEADPAGMKAAKDFWAAVAKADTEQMARLYAPKVLVKAGSELLKKQWGINDSGDRDKDLALQRDQLLKGYAVMIEKVGAEKWTRIFSEIKPEAIHISAVEADGKPFQPAQRGDVVLRVSTGTGDDTLAYLLRRVDGGAWQVVAEAADY